MFKSRTTNGHLLVWFRQWEITIMCCKWCERKLFLNPDGFVYHVSGSHITWRQQVGGRTITPTDQMEIANVRGWENRCSCIVFRQTASTAQVGDSKHGLHCSSHNCSSVLRQINRLTPGTANSFFFAWIQQKESAHAETVPCASKLPVLAGSSLGVGSRKPAPPELSTRALETKTGRDLSSQVVNNSRFASILIRLAHVYV